MPCQTIRYDTAHSWQARRSSRWRRKNRQTQLGKSEETQEIAPHHFNSHPYFDGTAVYQPPLNPGAGRIHYIEKGSGEAVVLIHGTGVTADDYMASGVVNRLAERYRVVAFDRPGYGYSERPGRGWSAAAQAE